MSDKKTTISIDNLREVLNRISNNPETREHFVEGIKTVVKVELKWLLLMFAGLFLLLFGILSFVGLVSFLEGLVMFGVKIARFTLGENESFTDIMLDKEKDDFR